MSTVDFDHRTPGTDVTRWRDTIAALPAVTPPRAARAVVVAAHPDDETLGAGGTIAALAALGIGVDVLVATDGEASHPASPTHTPARLAAVRRGEVRRAVARLAPGVEPVLLGLPDGALEDHEPRLADEIGALVRADGTRPAAGIVITPWLHDGHPDHEACARATTTALAASGPTPADAAVLHWQYPVWAWHWARPDDDRLPTGRMHRVRLDDASRRSKHDALAEHRSQHEPLSEAAGDEAILPPAFRAHFEQADEVFVVEPPAAQASYFDALYATSDDPWRLGSSFYERRKRACTVAAIPVEHAQLGFEPGCATGLITQDLAGRCTEVIAWDGAERALEQARRRVPAGRVTFERRRIPDDWPDRSPDLVVLSEVGYYCPDLDALVARLRSGSAARAAVVACHWRHAAPDHPHDGDTVHAALRAGLVDWTHAVQHVEADFRLDVWTRGMGSVARTDGVLA